MQKRFVKGILKAVYAFMVVVMLLSTVVIGASATTSALSTYTCDFEDNYYSNLSGNTCTGGAIVTDGSKALKFSANSDAENHRFEVYNSSMGDFKLNDGKMYAVTLRYKVENISAGKETTQPTQIFLVKYNGGDTLVKLKAFADASFFPGDKTEWITQTVVFKASIGSAVDYNRLAVSVFSPSCPTTPTSVERNKTTILFDDIVVREYDGNSNAIEFQVNGGSHCEAIVSVAGAQITLPTPTRQYYDFAGWYTDSSLKEPFKGTTMPDRAVTKLYAKWNVSASAIKVDFDARGGETPQYVVGAAGDPVTLPTLSMSGLRFAGWFDKTMTTRYEFTALPSESMTLYAKWEVIPVYCGYENVDDFSKPNNGTFSKRCELTTDEKFEGKTSLMYDYSIGTSNGYKATAGIEIVDEKGERPTLQANTEYTIQFKYKVVSVNMPGAFCMVTGGMNGAWTNRVELIKFEDGLAYDASDIGKGWQSGSISFKTSENTGSNFPFFSIGGDARVYVDELMLYRKTPNAEYKGCMVSFDTQGGPFVDSIFGKVGDAITLPAEAPVREGYRFLGWCNDPEGNEPFEGGTITGGYKVIYADWFKEWVEPENNETNTPTEEPDTPINEGKTKSNLLLYIIIAAAAVVIIAIVVVVIIVLKKKKAAAKEPAENDLEEKSVKEE